MNSSYATSSQHYIWLIQKYFLESKHPNFEIYFQILFLNDGLMHDCGIPIANALEIPDSCTKPSISSALLYIHMDTDEYGSSIPIADGASLALITSYSHRGISLTFFA